MRAIKAIAFNTIKEGVRDKVFLNLLVFGVLIISASILIGDLSIGMREKFMKDMGLAAISLIGVSTAILLSTGLLHRELDQGTIYSVIYRPMRRWQFLIGKYLGVCAIAGIDVAVMGAMFLSLLLLRGYGVHAGLLKAIYLTYAELALVASLGVLFSLISSPTPSALFTAAVYLAGQMSGELRGIASASQEALPRYLSGVIYYLLPNFGLLNVRLEAAYGLSIDPLYLGKVTLYAVLYAALILILASWRFERRELT